MLYKRAIRELLDAEPNLTLLQQNVDGLMLDGQLVRGVITQAGMRIAAQVVVLTVGTFLDGKIHVGQVNYSGGRAGDPGSADPLFSANVVLILPLVPPLDSFEGLA